MCVCVDICGYMRIYAECDSCNFEALQIEMLQATSRPFLANISIYLRISTHLCSFCQDMSRLAGSEMRSRHAESWPPSACHSLDTYCKASKLQHASVLGYDMLWLLWHWHDITEGVDTGWTPGWTPVQTCCILLLCSATVLLDSGHCQLLATSSHQLFQLANRFAGASLEHAMHQRFP